VSDDIELPHNWEPRDYQLELWRYLRGNAKLGIPPGLRADVAAHRRWGKDEVALHFAATKMATKPGTYWHMLPEASQARKAVWDAINPHTGMRRIDEAFPKQLRATTREQDMLIRLKNGATWQVMGSDNYNSLVGSPPVGVVLSEWSLAKPDAWTYLRPVLAENGGWALFLWTPRGRNHATRAFEAREKDPTWYAKRSPATLTSVFTPEALEKERLEMIAEAGSVEEGQAKFETEYMVNFDVATPGSYYGTALSDAKAQGRICTVPYDPALKVDTAWDLGIDDYTAIWFVQQTANQIRVIDYYETGGEGLQSIVREAIASKPYIYGTHYLPHDVMVRELGAAGRSRYETLKGLGMGVIDVGKATDPEDRINATRLTIPLCYFDAVKCEPGLDRLRGYRKKWNRALAAFTGPLHDENSHGADAFGEFAINRQAPRLKAAKAKREPRGWMS
jgi:phage terminase large subunit